MSVLSLSYWESDVYWRQNNKHFAELAPQNGGKNDRKKLRHCHPMYYQQLSRPCTNSRLRVQHSRHHRKAMMLLNILDWYGVHCRDSLAGAAASSFHHLALFLPTSLPFPPSCSFFFPSCPLEPLHPIPIPPSTWSVVCSLRAHRCHLLWN